MRTNILFLFSITLLLIILLIVTSCSDFNPLEAGGIGDFMIYWNESYSSIHRAHLDGTSSEKVLDTGFSSDSYMRCIAVDKKNDKLYFARDNDGSSAYIYKANLDGTGMEEIIDANIGLYSFYNMELDLVNNVIYWCGSGLAIYKCSMDGGTPINIHSTVNPSYDIALDVSNGYIYYTDGYNIKKGVLSDPGDADNVFSSDLSYEPLRLFLDLRNNKIIWSDWDDNGNSRINKANLDGTSQIELYSIAMFISGKTFTGDSFEQQIYWIENQEIKGLNYGDNGSAVTLLSVSSSVDALFLDLLP